MGYVDKQPSRMVGVGQGRGKPRLGAEAIVFSVLPLHVALMRAMLVGGI
jgi:hypothetical protein